MASSVLSQILSSRRIPKKKNKLTHTCRSVLFANSSAYDLATCGLATQALICFVLFFLNFFLRTHWYEPRWRSTALAQSRTKPVVWTEKSRNFHKNISEKWRRQAARQDTLLRLFRNNAILWLMSARFHLTSGSHLLLADVSPKSSSGFEPARISPRRS